MNNLDVQDLQFPKKEELVLRLPVSLVMRIYEKLKRQEAPYEVYTLSQELMVAIKDQQ